MFFRAVRTTHDSRPSAWALDTAVVRIRHIESHKIPHIQRVQGAPRIIEWLDRRVPKVFPAVGDFVGEGSTLNAWQWVPPTDPTDEPEKNG